MRNRGVKVVVDYTNGYYNIIGTHENRPYTIRKPIRGVDRDGFFKASYSRKMLKLRRKEIEHAIERIVKEEPNFKYSKKMINKIDPMMFKVLQDWDMMENTQYSRLYLKSMLQYLDRDQTFYVARSFYEDECADIRKDALELSGIDISYNVGLINVGGGLNLIDRIKGMRIANAQKKLCKAQVNSTIFVKKDYYLDDIENFANDEDVIDNIEEPYEDEENRKELARQYRQNQVIRKFVEEEQIRKRVAKEVQDIMANMELEKLEQTRADEISQIIDEENIDFHKNDAVQEDVVQEDVVQEDVVQEDTVQEKIKNKSERTRLTKKQRESLARKAKKEYNSHYNTQMRLKSQKEQKNKLAKEGIQKANEKRKKELELQKNIELEEKARIQREEELKLAMKREEERKKLLEKQYEEEQKRLLEQAKLKRQQKFDKMFNNKVTRRAKAEVRHWKRKIRNAKESIKNFEFKSSKDKLNKPKADKEDKLKRTLHAPIFALASFNMPALKRRAKAEVRHWKRKIRNAKESIKNLKFKPLTEKGKKRLITGAVSILAVGLIFVGVNKISNLSNDISTNDQNIIITQGINDNTEQIGAEREETEIGDVEQGGAEQEETETGDVEQGRTEQEEIETGDVEQGGVEQEETEIGDVEQGGVEQEETETGDVEQGGAEQEETETGDTEQSEIEKTDKEKIEEFKQLAMEKYRDALVIGEVPQIGDILSDQVYHENPNGTGKIGYFSAHPDYEIGHINIITNDKNNPFKTIRADGRNLSELLSEYPDYVTYNIHFVDSNGGWLGFITQEQYEKLVQDKINQIIESKTDKIIDFEDELMH